MNADRLSARAFAVLCLLWLAACQVAPPPPKGGSSTQRVPLAAEQHMVQPDAPEGISRQFWEERTTTHSPDGITTVREIRAGTDLGGSQDWAKIVAQYARADLLKGLLIALGLLIGGILAWRHDWPLAAACLFLGAFASLALAWWAGLLGIAGALLIRLAYTAALTQRP